MIQGRDDVHIGNINSPNQIVLSGNTEAVKNLGKKLKEMGYRAPSCGSAWPSTLLS